MWLTDWGCFSKKQVSLGLWDCGEEMPQDRFLVEQGPSIPGYPDPPEA